MATFEPDSWKPAVNTLTWFLMVTAIIGVFARLGTKYWIIRRWTADDYLSIASMIMLAAQSVAVSMATANGYGDRIQTLSETSVQSVMKSQYAATILFITSMCFSKLSIIHFIQNVAPFDPDRLITVGLGVFTIIWAVTGILTSAFQCKLPQTWNYLYSECFNIEAWWTYLCVVNIVSDTAVMTHGIILIVRLQTQLKRKIVLTTIFGLRISVIAAIACQLCYARKAVYSTDPMSEAWPLTLSTQAVQCLSVITACAPQFKPFMENLRSSGFCLDEIGRYGASRSGYNKSTPARSQQKRCSQLYELSIISPFKGPSQTATTVLTSKRDWDVASQSSQTHIIHEVRKYAVSTSANDSSHASS